MAKLPRILCIPPHDKWYVEAHVEYLIRYLSDEFFFEIAHIDDPINNPMDRNPDDFDLIWCLWPGAWMGLDSAIYGPKAVTVFYGPNEGPYKNLAAVGASTPIVEQSLQGFPYHSLRFGVDTNLFAPNLKMAREDDLLHVGYLGNHANVRHMVGPVISKLTDIKGVRLMMFPHNWQNNGGTWTDWEGEKMKKYVVGGNKLWTGLPNIYNRMDILLRMDQDPAYSFPTQEAAACGVAVIATNSGIDHLFAEAGAAILIPGDRPYYMTQTDDVAKKVKEAIIDLRDNPAKRKEMGKKGREEILKNWTWDKHIDSWRKFFREGVKNATK